MILELGVWAACSGAIYVGLKSRGWYRRWKRSRWTSEQKAEAYGWVKWCKTCKSEWSESTCSYQPYYRAAHSDWAHILPRAVKGCTCANCKWNEKHAPSRSAIPEDPLRYSSLVAAKT